MRTATAGSIALFSVAIAGCAIAQMSQAPPASELQNSPFVVQSSPPSLWLEFPINEPSSCPGSLTIGADSQIWFGDGCRAAIGKISNKGVAVEYAIPGAKTDEGVAVARGTAPDVWFTVGAPDGSLENNIAGFISTDGSITEFSLPSGTTPGRIAHGPDGNFWFTEPIGNNIVRITPSGKMTVFPVPSEKAYPNAIVRGPDGNMWFTESNNGAPGAVGQITMQGKISEYRLEFAPESIAAASDGGLWVSQSNGLHEVARISTSGSVTYVPIGRRQGGGAVAPGPGGQPWYIVGNEFWHIIFPSDRPSIVTTIPGGYSSTGGMILGPDHNFWIAESARGAIGVYVRRQQMVTPSALTFSYIGEQQSFTVTETDFKGLFKESGCDPSIATVSPQGLATTFTVTAQGPGACIISVTDEHRDLSHVNVSVSPGPSAQSK